MCALEFTQDYDDSLSVLPLLPHQNRLLPSKSQAPTLRRGVFRAQTRIPRLSCL